MRTIKTIMKDLYLKKYKELQENGNGIEKPRRHIHRWQIRYGIIVLLAVLLLATTY